MLTPESISAKRFEKQMGGYRQEAVDNFLQQVAEDYGRLTAEKEDMENKMEVLAKQIEHYREDEDSLRNALIGAQKLGDSVIRESKAKAEYMIREAKNKSDRMMETAQKNIEKEHMSLIKMQKEVTKFKNRLLTLYKQHLEMISALPDYDQEDEMSGEEEELSRPEKQMSSFSLRKEDANSDAQQSATQPESAFTQQPSAPVPGCAPSQQAQPSAPRQEETNSMIIDFVSASNQSENNQNLRREELYPGNETGELSFYPSASAQQNQSNDSKFGPLKFGEGFDVERDNPNKNLFTRKKHR